MPINAEDQQRQTIRRLFTRIATEYDRINRVLSLGQDLRWRKAALAETQLSSGGRLLDVATGTGDMVLLASSLWPGALVVGADLTPAMLDVARRKAGEQVLALAVCDGLRLAFADNTYDAVTSAFLMRNVPDVGQALREQQRVTRPGGRVVCLEMTWPQRRLISTLFGLYFFSIPPLIGRLVGQSEAYQYLPRSVRGFLSPSALAQEMEKAGLREVRWSLRMAGSVAIHVGVKPQLP